MELTPPEGDLAIQATIYWDHVSYLILYRYTDVRADKVFEQLLDYLKLVNVKLWAFSFTTRKQIEHLIQRKY